MTPNRYIIKLVYNHYSLIKRDVVNRDRDKLSINSINNYIHRNPNKESIKIMDNAERQEQ